MRQILAALCLLAGAAAQDQDFIPIVGGSGSNSGGPMQSFGSGNSIAQALPPPNDPFFQPANQPGNRPNPLPIFPKTLQAGTPYEAPVDFVFLHKHPYKDPFRTDQTVNSYTNPIGRAYPNIPRTLGRERIWFDPRSDPNSDISKAEAERKKKSMIFYGLAPQIEKAHLADEFAPSNIPFTSDWDRYYDRFTEESSVPMKLPALTAIKRPTIAKIPYYATDRTKREADMDETTTTTEVTPETTTEDEAFSTTLPKDITESTPSFETTTTIGSTVSLGETTAVTSTPSTTSTLSTTTSSSPPTTLLTTTSAQSTLSTPSVSTLSTVSSSSSSIHPSTLSTTSTSASSHLSSTTSVTSAPTTQKATTSTTPLPFILPSHRLFNPSPVRPSLAVDQKNITLAHSTDHGPTIAFRPRVKTTTTAMPTILTTKGHVVNKVPIRTTQGIKAIASTEKPKPVNNSFGSVKLHNESPSTISSSTTNVTATTAKLPLRTTHFQTRNHGKIGPIHPQSHLFRKHNASRITTFARIGTSITTASTIKSSDRPTTTTTISTPSIAGASTTTTTTIHPPTRNHQIHLVKHVANATKTTARPFRVFSTRRPTVTAVPKVPLLNPNDNKEIDMNNVGTLRNEVNQLLSTVVQLQSTVIAQQQRIALLENQLRLRRATAKRSSKLHGMKTHFVNQNGKVVQRTITKTRGNTSSGVGRDAVHKDTSLNEEVKKIQRRFASTRMAHGMI